MSPLHVAIQREKVDMKRFEQLAELVTEQDASEI